jgi:hypothetical protein
VRTPEEALEEARRRAGEGPALHGSPASESTQSVEDARRESLRRLAIWAVIEPEEAEVYSTRRLGAPITLLKRFLVRLLRQYLVQISAQQSRFNAHVAAHVISLEDRVAALEQAAPRRSTPEARDGEQRGQDEAGRR